MIKKLNSVIFIACLALLVLIKAEAVQAVEIFDNRVVEQNKTWIINFSNEISLEDNLDKIMVTDSKSNTINDVKLSLGEDGKSILVTAPPSGYLPGENYTLSIDDKFQDKNHRMLKDKIVLPFSIGTTVKQIHAFYPLGINYGSKSDAFIQAVDSVSFPWSKLEYATSETEKQIKLSLLYNEGSIGSDIKEPLKHIRAYGKSAQLSIFADDNAASTYKIISNMLPYSEKRQALINSIIQTLEKGINIGDGQVFKFDGVVIDFEGLGNDKIGEKLTSEYFVDFLRELKERLNSLETRKTLYVAANVSVYFKGYDYANIAKNCDKLILMAHDYEPKEAITKNDIMKYINYSESNNINSLAPIKEVDKALKIAVQGLYGNELNKIWLQINFASRQWEFNTDGSDGWKSLSGGVLSLRPSAPEYMKIKLRLENYTDTENLEVNYNEQLQTPYTTFYSKSRGTFNFVLYEDSRSVKAKIDAANKYGIGGISIWAWGNVPDFDDATGKKYFLDVWQQMFKAIKK